MDHHQYAGHSTVRMTEESTKIQLTRQGDLVVAHQPRGPRYSVAIRNWVNQAKIGQSQRAEDYLKLMMVRGYPL